MGMILKAFSGLADGLGFALGAMCLAAAVAAHGGRISGRLDILTHFAPFWLAGAAVALVYGLAFAAPGLRSTIATMGVVGMLAAAALIAPEYLRPISPNAPADAPHQVKIIQFNGWKNNADVDATADWLVAQNPDVIAVEELEAPLRDALLKRQNYEISRGMLHTTIFSRAAPLHRAFQLEAPWDAWPGIARARLTAPDGGAYDIMALHYTWPTQWFQKIQRRSVTGLVDRYDRKRLIVLGDMNLTPWSFALQQQDKRWGLERRDRALFTWPVRPFFHRHLSSPLPFLPIDHIYAGSDWRTVSIQRGPRLGSDHLPVVIVLALKS